MGAGVGSRFRGRVPKPLLPLRREGETILSRQMRQLRHAGFEDITLAITHNNWQTYMTSGIKVNLKVVLNRGFECMSTLMQCKSLLSNTLILHGDVVMEDSVLNEILRNDIDDLFFIMNEEEVYAIMMNEIGAKQIKKVEEPLLTKIDGKEKYIQIKEARLWELYYHFLLKGPVISYHPVGFITDIDYQQEHFDIIRRMKEMRI